MQFLPPPGSSLYIPLVVLYALTALSPVLFICLYLRERRSVFVGWLLIVTVGLLGTSLGAMAVVSENQILLVLALLIVIIPVILSLFTPLGLTGLFLYSGVRLIAREGFSLTNSLALAAGVALIVGAVLCSRFGGECSVWRRVGHYLFLFFAGADLFHYLRGGLYCGGSVEPGKFPPAG